MVPIKIELNIQAVSRFRHAKNVIYQTRKKNIWITLPNNEKEALESFQTPQGKCNRLHVN